MKQQPTAVIDIGTSKVICAIGLVDDFQVTDVLAYGVGQYDGMRQGRIDNVQDFTHAVHQAIVSAEDAAGMKLRQVRVGVPGALVRTAMQRRSTPVLSKDCAVTQKEVDTLLRAIRKVPLGGEWLRLHSVVYDYELADGERVSHPLSRTAAELAVHFSLVVADRAFVELVMAICKKMHVDIRQFVAVPQAQALFVLSKRDRQRPCVLVDVGMYATDVTVMHKNAILYHWSLDVGGASITGDIASGLSIDGSQAEQLKRRYVFGDDQRTLFSPETMRAPGPSLREIVETRVDEMAGLIREIMDESGAEMDERTRVYLAGGGLSMMRGIRPYLEDKLRAQVRTFTLDSAVVYAPNHFSAVSLLPCDARSLSLLNCDWKREQELGGKGGLLNKMLTRKNNYHRGY